MHKTRRVVLTLTEPVKLARAKIMGYHHAPVLLQRLGQIEYRSWWDFHRRPYKTGNLFWIVFNEFDWIFWQHVDLVV